MSAQKVSSIKIPTFDKEHYTLWKRKMTLFIKTANPLYLGILENGPFIPQSYVPETTVDGETIPAYWVPKKVSEYSDTEKEKVSLDDCLQFIIIEALDNVMYNNIVNCTSAKQIWETIEVLCEGTEEVKENQEQILVSQYEAFMAKPSKGLTEMFERFNRLINDLQLHGKFYDKKEINMKFMLTLPEHLEHKVTAIREGRDMSKVSLETLYGILKTYELELVQKRAIQSGQRGKMANTSNALVAQDPKMLQIHETQQQQIKIEDVTTQKIL